MVGREAVGVDLSGIFYEVDHEGTSNSIRVFLLRTIVGVNASVNWLLVLRYFIAVDPGDGVGSWRCIF